MFKTRWFVIGISGVTCSGKTTLATALYNYFINNKNRPIFNSNVIVEDAALISQDNYFLSKDDDRHQLIKKLNHINWEILEALNMDKMLNDIHEILTNNYILYDKTIEMQYSTSHNNDDNNKNFNINNDKNLINNCIPSSSASLKKYQQQYQQNYQYNNEIRRCKILIIEGFLIFNDPQLFQLCQIKFHIHLPYEKCYERRLKRIYDPPDVTGYFEICIWPMYEKHFNEFKDCDDIYMLNGETPKEKIFKYVLNCLGSFL